MSNLKKDSASTDKVQNKSTDNNEIKKKLKWSGLKTYVKVLIISFSVILFLACCAAGYFYYYISDTNKTINSQTTTQIANLLTPVEAPEAPVTILLLGRDTRDAETDLGRADTIMVLHINPAEKRASLLSIPRDTLVEIPGHGEDKINAAYAYGGEELMIKTVSNFLDAAINHYITIDFDGFIKLIDELGGVDVIVERPLEDPKTGAYISAGNHHFTGEQALAFTRSRSTELGDIGRIQRQQYVLKELIKQKLNLSNVSRINDFFNIIVENTRTDLDLMTIISYARAALSFSMENISSAIIPTHPDWIKDGTVSVQVPDTDEARAMWQRIIFGQPMSKYGAEYTEGTPPIPESMVKNSIYYFGLVLKNTGTITWEGTGLEPCYVSYHWLNFDTKKTVVFDGERTVLPQSEVLPGEEVEINMKVLSPSEPGKYILQIDMVHEGKTWFSFQGVPMLEKYVSVNIDYAATYDDGGTTPNQVKPGEEFMTYVTVTNNGYMTWLHDSDEPVRLGYHWYNRDTREVVDFGAGRGLLPEDLEHGQSAEVEMIVTAPLKPGRYILAYDLVHEKVTWFSQQGVFPLEIDVDDGVTIDNSIAKKTSIIIYNGSGISGAASEFRDYLKGYNFIIYDIANAREYDFEKTLVIYNSGKEEKVKQLEQVLNTYATEQYSNKWADYSSKADIIIILGKDYKENIIEE